MPEEEEAVNKVLQHHSKEVESYLAGNSGILGFLVGQVMIDLQGRANPVEITRLVQERLQP